MAKSIASFVGDELSFLKLGSVLVVFTWGALIYFLKANIAKLLLSRLNYCFGLHVDWN